MIKGVADEPSSPATTPHKEKAPPRREESKHSILMIGGVFSVHILPPSARVRNPSNELSP
jgi:hypothetical protein